jgi:ethanolamine ammonia-lyase large subunit
LGLVNEIRNLYLGNFPYEYFDSKQQVLIDLDNDYQRLVQANYEDAERLKWSRISAIFLGVNKDQAREIDEDFFEDEVVKRLGHKPETSDLFKVETEIVNSDLEEFLEDSIPRTDMKNFAKTLINELATAEGKILPEVDQKYTEILTQVRLAADEIITSKKLESYLAEPSDVLRETRINLDKITENFGEISEISGFNSGDFDYELKKVAKALTDLTAKYKKYLDS